MHLCNEVGVITSEMLCSGGRVLALLRRAGSSSSSTCSPLL